jgi:hypothetical protein
MFTAKTQRRKAVVITSFVTPQIIAFIKLREPERSEWAQG